MASLRNLADCIQVHEAVIEYHHRCWLDVIHHPERFEDSDEIHINTDLEYESDEMERMAAMHDFDPDYDDD